MKMIRIIFMLLASVAVCRIQAVNISGVVKNSTGSGFEGVKVRLGKAAITTTTGSDGSFTLKDGTGLGHEPHSNVPGGDRPFRLEENGFFFSGDATSPVTVSIYDCKGRLGACAAGPALRGGGSMTIPPVARGIHIYRISVGDEQYLFRRVAGIAANRIPASLRTTAAFADREMKAVAQLDDAILCIKEGYQLYRLAVKKPDTSGIQVTMSPLETGTVTDVEGNAYRTVKIGNQVWTAENLRTTKYNDGSGIGSGCHFYNNSSDAAAKKKWGALYTWAAASNGKLAPTGWHVPTKAEWETLQNYLITQGYNYDGTTSENKIAKSLAATTDWEKNGETGAIGNDLNLNNASGFSALPAGYRYYTGEYLEQNIMGFFWTATQYDGSFAWHRSLWSINFDFYETNRVKTLECSVRLIKNN